MRSVAVHCSVAWLVGGASMSPWVRAGKCSEYVAHTLARAFADCLPSTARLAEHFLLFLSAFLFRWCLSFTLHVLHVPEPGYSRFAPSNFFFLSVINVAHSCSPILSHFE